MARNNLSDFCVFFCTEMCEKVKEVFSLHGQQFRNSIVYFCKVCYTFNVCGYYLQPFEIVAL